MLKYEERRFSSDGRGGSGVGDRDRVGILP